MHDVDNASCMTRLHLSGPAEIESLVQNTKIVGIRYGWSLTSPIVYLVCQGPHHSHLVRADQVGRVGGGPLEFFEDCRTFDTEFRNWSCSENQE